jgi:hypothetical protein
MTNAFYQAKIYVSFRNRKFPDRFPLEVWEMIIVFNAESAAAAQHKVELRGLEEQFPMDDITWLADDEPMYQKFEGHRGLGQLNCHNTSTENATSVSNGALITHSVFEVRPDGESLILTSSAGCSFNYLGDESETEHWPALFDVVSLQVLSRDLTTFAAVEQQDEPTMWHGAHLLFTLPAGIGVDSLTSKFVLEIVVLVGSTSVNQAFENARRLGKRFCKISSSSGYCPSLKFLGIRQVIQVDNQSLGCDFFDLPPSDQTEVTFSKFSLSDAQSLNLLVSGNDAPVSFLH